MPRPSRALTVTTGASRYGVPARKASVSARASSSSSSSTRSALVSATTPSVDPEQLDDREVLHGLRHDAVVGGDDEQEEVDAGRPGHHGAHEALVAGDVDDAEPATAGEIELGVAQLDRDAAFALLAQAVGVLAGQQRDQRGLAVVDVAGGAEGEDRAPRLGGGSAPATPQSCSRSATSPRSAAAATAMRSATSASRTVRASSSRRRLVHAADDGRARRRAAAPRGRRGRRPAA